MDELACRSVNHSVCVCVHSRERMLLRVRNLVTDGWKRNSTYTHHYSVSFTAYIDVATRKLSADTHTKKTISFKINKIIESFLYDSAHERVLKTNATV